MGVFANRIGHCYSAEYHFSLNGHRDLISLMKLRRRAMPGTPLQAVLVVWNVCTCGDTDIMLVLAVSTLFSLWVHQSLNLVIIYSM